ncbi:MAG: prolipoprotein diacylglyceryl transferase [Candidatus Bipolaricaulia bacterium]
MHPILVEFGSFTIRYYGLMYVIALVVGIYLIQKEAKRRKIGLDLDGVLDLVLVTFPVGLIGARLYYVAFEWDYYGTHLGDIPKIWQGGLAIHGGLIAGVIAGYLYARWKGISFWKLADAVAPSLILGQVLGRFGNFMNGDAYGTPTDLPWGMVFPTDTPAGTEYPGVPLHPTMLYELALNLIIFAILWWWVRNRVHRAGFVFSLYLILYSVARFFVSFVRGDSLYLGELRVAQLISIVLILVFGTFILQKRLWQPS